MRNLSSLSLAGNPLHELPPSLGLRSSLRILVLDGIPDTGPGTAELVAGYIEASAKLRTANGVQGTAAGMSVGVKSPTTLSAEVLKATEGIMEGGNAVFPPSLLELELAMFAGQRVGDDDSVSVSVLPMGGGDRRSMASGVSGSTLVPPPSITTTQQQQPGRPASPGTIIRNDVLRARHRALRRLLMHLRDCNDLDDAVRRVEEAEREEAIRRRARGESDKDSTSMREDGASEFGVPLSMLGMGRTGATTPSLKGSGGIASAVALPMKKPKSAEFRAQLVREILATERTYVAAMRNLMDLYVAPLEAGGEKDRILSKEEHGRVFQNVQSIVGLHMWVSVLCANGEPNRMCVRD